MGSLEVLWDGAGYDFWASKEPFQKRRRRDRRQPGASINLMAIFTMTKFLARRMQSKTFVKGNHKTNAKLPFWG